MPIRSQHKTQCDSRVESGVHLPPQQILDPLNSTGDFIRGTASGKPALL